MLTMMMWSAAFGATVAEVYDIPAGFEEVPPTAFGAWLGRLELADASEPVRTHAGDVVSHRARVIRLPMTSGDLQQCADSAIRLRAQWLKETGGSISFHATSGDSIGWDRFVGGETPYAVGNGLKWRQGSSGAWEDYLRLVFTWAGTWSLQTYDTRSVSEARAGDLLLQGGFPGHAVVLLRVAVREGPSPEVRVLIGEGFMPAQSFHVELGPHDGWWTLASTGLDLPHWRFGADSLRRWK
ncbi:MAG: DUF4846 domain-containing protein [Myxococcales bacterium]|nr:DUF4846 domain-containing protein [Myxococcales bacterium]